MTQVNPALASALVSDVDKATALYNESLTYLRLASDHAKFIRNYFDPTQEQLFRMADSLAVSLDQLRMEICGFAEPVSPAVINEFVRKAGPVNHVMGMPTPTRATLGLPGPPQERRRWRAPAAYKQGEPRSPHDPPPVPRTKT